MAERHRGTGREGNRGEWRREGRDARREGGRDGGRGGGPGGFRPSFRDRSGFQDRPPFRDRPAFQERPEFQDRRAPSAPEEVGDDFQEVDAELAIAILDTATRLTEIVGTTGLPEETAARRQAVAETFELLYYSVLETVTGGEEEAEDEDEEEE